MTIVAKDLVIDFPVYGAASSRSFKKIILNAATGGVLAKDAGERTVVRALDHVSFELFEGDRVGLVGHNGSGKSTLLRALAGVYEPTEGSLRVDGRVTSMLSITLGMDVDGTGIENIYLRGQVMGLRKKQIDDLVDEIAEFSGIGNYLNLPMRTYSSGMSMRLAFAISTCVDAEIILMDEWLSVGDSEFLEKARARLDGMVKRAKIVVMASHDHDLVMKQCNKVIKLERGRIVSFQELSSNNQ